MLEMVELVLLQVFLDLVSLILEAAAVVAFLVLLVREAPAAVVLVLYRQQVVLLEAQILAVGAVAVGGQAPLTRQQAQAAPALSSWNTKHHHKPYSPSKGLVSGLCLLVLRQLITWSLLVEVEVELELGHSQVKVVVEVELVGLGQVQDWQLLLEILWLSQLEPQERVVQAAQQQAGLEEILQFQELILRMEQLPLLVAGEEDVLLRLTAEPQITALMEALEGAAAVHMVEQAVLLEMVIHHHLHHLRTQTLHKVVMVVTV
jgi:hypothetical protein